MIYLLGGDTGVIQVDVAFGTPQSEAIANKINTLPNGDGTNENNNPLDVHGCRKHRRVVRNNMTAASVTADKPNHLYRGTQIKAFLRRENHFCSLLWYEYPGQQLPFDSSHPDGVSSSIWSNKADVRSLIT